MSTPYYPFPGIQVHESRHGATVLTLHYNADPQKGDGEKTHVKEIGLDLSPWALAEFKKMTDPSLYLQEFEVKFGATLGQLIYHLDEEATVEESFPIPENWTRYVALDPHPGVPHAFLWCAVDLWGDRWYYRELWPSRVCFRYNNGLLLGDKGPCPDNDIESTIKDYVETVQYLESSDNPENVRKDGTRFDEKIYKRVIDYAARAFGKGTNDDPEQPNFQQRYEHWMSQPKTRVSCPSFDDAKKDHDVGFATVNEGLKVGRAMDAEGNFRKRSHIHIFGDKCTELIYQLKNNRKQLLTPEQAARMDPTGRAVQVRAHMVDDMRYIEMAHPIYVSPDKPKSTWKPHVEGIAY